MPQLKKNISKSGRISYSIRVSAGYTSDGRQKKRSMTWTPPADMTPKQAEREALRIAFQFEDEVLSGEYQMQNVTFEQFSEKWLNEYASVHLKLRTVESYRRMLPTINAGIGHLRLTEIRAGHLTSFYQNLLEPGINKKGSCMARGNLKAVLKEKGITQKALCEKTGISERTMRATVHGDSIDTQTATKIARGLKCRVADLFESEQKGLSAASVRRHHALISGILTRACKWGYLTVNPAQNAELPKARRKEAAYLEETEARRLLELLQDAPEKYRYPTMFDLLSGLRRGELLGLRWCDIDFDNEMIQVVQNYVSVPGHGLMMDTPKTEQSARRLRLSRSAFLILRDVQDWQSEQRKLLGDAWIESGSVFTDEMGRTLRPDTYTNWFGAFARKNGFEGVHIHSLRHSYASLMIADGTPLVVVSRRMGHSLTSTTANIYAHMIQSADERAAEVTEKFADVLTSQKERRKVSNE